MLTLEEAQEKFPKAIRGIENLVCGQKYIKHYQNFSENLGRLTQIIFDKNNSVRLFFENVDSVACVLGFTYAADCGVIPYFKGYNPTNWLEVLE